MSTISNGGREQVSDDDHTKVQRIQQVLMRSLIRDHNELQVWIEHPNMLLNALNHDDPLILDDTLCQNNPTEPTNQWS
jgi:hypothetical protein